MISQGDVRTGKCFLSAGSKPQVVRVRTVADGVVSFEPLHPLGRATQGSASLAEFVAGLVREVGCDFRPGEPRIHV